MDNLAVVLLESLVFFFCWVAGFLSSCSSGSGAAGSRWSASELPLLVLGLSSSDLCLSLDILINLSLGKLLKEKRGVGEMLNLRNKSTAFASWHTHLKSHFNDKAWKCSHLSHGTARLQGGDESYTSVRGFTELKLENPLTFFFLFRPLDNLSIVYFLRRNETDLPWNLSNEH